MEVIVTRNGPGQPGAVLIEVVLSVAILGMVGIGFLTALSTGIITTARVDERTTAINLARSQLEDVKLQSYIEPTAYATITPPAGYTIKLKDTTLNTNVLQEIVVNVASNGEKIVELGGYKVNTLPSSRFRSGSYVGNGVDNRRITGVGFEPDVVIIKGDVDEVAVMRTSSMGGDGTKPLVGSSGLTADLVQSLDVDGLTVGTDSRVNGKGVRYHWMAFKAGSMELEVGSYTGSGTGRSIEGVGFSPEYVIVMPATGKEAVQRSAAMPSTFFFDEDTGGENRVTSLDADGFSVGDSSRVNSAGVTYHYVAWNAVAGKMGVGSYTGDGSDGRSITGVGFEPGYVITRPEARAADKNSAHKPASSGVGRDLSLDFRASDNDVNDIQALEPDGFQVGSGGQVNASGRTFYWMAFR